MKTSRAFLAVSIAALVLAIILIFLKTYYVAIALIVGTLIMGYPELWSSVAGRRLPPLDERVRENVGKSMRNGFISFAIALAGLMLFFSINRRAEPDILFVLAGLFLSAGVVYLLSYLHYDRAEPKLDERGAKKLRTFLLIAGISAGAFVVSFILHNVIYGLFIIWFGADFWDRTGLVDEPVFFFIALLSLVALAVGLIGSLVIFIKGLFGKSAER